MDGTLAEYTTQAAIDAALSRLRQCHDSGRTRSADWRRDQLRGLLRLVDAEEPALLAALHADLRKGRVEARLTEIAPLRDTIRHALRNLSRWMRPRRARSPVLVWPARSRILPEPLGVVLNISAWNYPVFLSLAPMAGMLAAGNCVMLKPSELAGESARTLARLLPQYLDPDAVAVLQGGPAETGAILERRFDHILYTGNGRVGRIVMAAAARHLTPVTLELGGRNPVIVDQSADIALAARRIAWAKLTCAGQICITADHVLVHESRKDALVEALRAQFTAMLGPDPQQSADYARIVNPRHFDRLTALLGQGRILHGGRHDRSDLYLEPTLIDRLDPDAPILQDEVFGPLLPIQTWQDEADLIAGLRQRDKPLALYVFAQDRAFADRILASTSAGNVAINDLIMFMAVQDLPFGGVGASGMGAYKGQRGFETFSHLKPVIRRGGWLDLPARYPPYDRAKERLLRLVWR